MTNPTRTRADIKMHIDNWGPGIVGKVVLAMDGGKIVASMALSDLLESCSPPDKGIGDAVASHYPAPTDNESLTVAPQGVVEELRSDFEYLRATSADGVDAYGAANTCDKALMLLDEITELPEPSKWAREYIRARQPHTLIGWDKDHRLDLAAALIERAAMLESEGK